MSKRFFVFVYLCLLTACSIQDDRPNFSYPDSNISPDAPFPTLIPTATLNAVAAEQAQNAVDPQVALAVRIARLRARAGALARATF